MLPASLFDAPAFAMLGAPARVPVLLSVPHAGRDYARALLAAVRVGRGALAALEDPHVDGLVGQAVDAGAQAIVATAPRALIDLNRSMDDLDPAMLSPAMVSPGGLDPTRPLSRRAAAGLGLIPSRLGGAGAIWRRGLAPADVAGRIAGVYRPYHDAIAATLATMRDRYGVAVLLDCHSMPPPRGNAGPGVVLGDRFGVSCDPGLVVAVETACTDRRIAVVRNDPYAGGEIVARHGRPALGLHALQIEIDRRLYLSSNLRDPGPGFARTGALLAAIAMQVASAAMSAAGSAGSETAGAWAQAAE